MPRTDRVDVGNLVYHVINRSNGRLAVFDSDDAYRTFEALLCDGTEKFNIRVIAYVLMPNHWHLLLYPREDGNLSQFMAWLTNTHTRRYHVATGTVGQGHLYQGRYKSFLVDNDAHLLTVLKYIERNPVRARLSKTPEAWKWGSAYRRIYSTAKEKKLLAGSPVALPRGYQEWIHIPEPSEELATIRNAVNKGMPYGRVTWREQMVNKYSLQQVMRSPGRPMKLKNSG